MYTAIAITNKGAEDIASLEISELIKAKIIQKKDTVVKFSFKNLIDLCSVVYKAQSINRAVLLLSEFHVNKSLSESMIEIKRIMKKTLLNEWLSKGKSFRVECLRYGEHDFNSVDIEIESGKEIYKLTKNNVDFDAPNIIFYLYINDNKGYFGVDFSGIELSKRQYKIFNHPESLKGTTGYILVRESGFKTTMKLVDPFMGSGVIVIEAGLFALNFPVQYYSKNKLFFTNLDFFKEYGFEKFFKAHDSKIKKDKTNILGYDFQLRYLKATQKNAKLAGVDKNINLSKAEIEWLDTKLDKKTVDFIVSDPPRSSKHKDEKQTAKIYNELFYQADYILKKKGSVILLIKDTDLIEKAAKKHKFKIKKKYALNQGKEIFNILTFVREIQ